MLALTSDNKNRIMNLALRLSSLGAKLILTLYMARFFELSSLGSYGLVFSAVVVVITLLGQELGYMVKREIVGLSPQEALIKIRDQIVWYGANYILFSLIVALIIMTGISGVPTKYLLYILVIGIAESLGTMCYNNMNLFNQQVMANVALFVRAAAWIPFVVALGFFDNSYRNEDTVLIGWAVSSTIALAVPVWAWRDWGWKAVLRQSVDYSWMIKSVRKSSFIWFGALGLMVGGYVDRFFTNHFISIEMVGVMTFYYSFINAMAPLVESGALIFTAPKLVDLHRRKKIKRFWYETFKVMKQVGIGAAGLALILSVCVPVLGVLMGKAAFVDQMDTFWLLLVATWLNSMSLVLHYVLFAQHRDKPIWMGNILFVIPVIVGNLFFIPLYGFIGIGYSAIVSAIFLIIWRGKFIEWPSHISGRSRSS